MSSTINVVDFATGGDGTVEDPWSGWEAGVNAVASNSKIHFPAGYYTQSARIDMKKGWDVGGDGKENTVITSSFIGDAFLSSQMINSSTRVNTYFHDLQLHNTNAGNTGGGYVDVAGTFVRVHNIYIKGFKYGIIFDQTELGSVMFSQLEFPILAGLWLVNKDDHTCGGLGQFTNRIAVKENQFNDGSIQLIDDGGVSHDISNNNFNGGATHIRIAGTVSARIGINEMEGAASTAIMFESNTQAGTGVGGPASTSVENNLIVPVEGQAAISIASAAELTLFNNFFGNNPAVKVTGVANVNKLVSINNGNGGGGATFDGKTQKYFEVLSDASLSTPGDMKTPKIEVVSPALVIGNFALSSEWGSMAEVATLTGNDTRGRFTVISAGTGQAVNPTITLTFNAPFTVAPFASVSRNGGDLPAVLPIWTTTTTTLVITFPGTPAAEEAFTFEFIVLG